MRILKTIRNIVITVVVLVAVFAACGVAYVLITGRSDTNNTPEVAKSTESNVSLPKPTKPAPNARESAAIEALLSPIAIGSNTSMSVKTLAGSTCTISFTYNNVPSKDSGLIPKTADDYGNVTWSWTIDSSVPVGTWPAKVTCTLDKKSAVVIGNLQVTK